MFRRSILVTVFALVATLVAITPATSTDGAATSGVDASAIATGTIAGTIVASSGDVMASGWVKAFDATTGALIKGATADGVGDYVITGLPAGADVILEAGSDPLEFLYAQGFYNGARTFEDATPVTVVVDTSLDVDIPVETGSWANGHVTDEATTDPLEKVCVTALDNATDTWFDANDKSDDASGFYRLGLLPGSYSFYYSECSGNPTHVSEWWDDAPASGTATAVVVPVNGGVIPSFFDVALAGNAGSISGSFTGGDGGSRLGDGCVSILDATGGVYGSDDLGYSSDYKVTGLPTGVDLFVQFDDCGRAVWDTFWYDNRTSLASSDAIVLSSGEDRTGINGALEEFSDVSRTKWYFDDVLALLSEEMVSGYPDGTYRPQGTLTRGEMATVITNALRLRPTFPTVPPFTDVPINKWYAGFIDRLKQEGITNGYPDGTFRPLNTISRAEVSVFLVVALDETPTDPTADPFTDVDKDKWYAGYIDRLKQLGLTSGYPDGSFGPNNTITRAEIAAFINRAFLVG